MRSMNKQSSLRQNETGIVSIFVSLIIIVILTLITLGFVRIMGREQRETLDRQLSTQAFYAAETGINDAVAAITAGKYTAKSKSSCAPDTVLDSAKYNLDDGGTVGYTCVLFDQAPLNLEYQSVDDSTPTVVPINGQDPNDHTDSPPARTVRTLRISWQAETNPSTPGFLSSFPNLPSASDTPALRISLTPGSAGFSRDGLTDNTFIAFLYPQRSGSIRNFGSVPFVAGSGNRTSEGPVVNGSCNANTAKDPTGNAYSTDFPRYCNVDITNLNETQYFLTIRAIYGNANVVITGCGATPCSTASRLRLSGAQTLVDSTGKAADVFRRLQVRVPSRNEYTYPGFAIESGFSLCKLYEVEPNSGRSLSTACDLP